MSWLRVSIGSSDMDNHVFAYNDLPPTDAGTDLRRFSLALDERVGIPVLREILAISPHFPILALPPSMPAWMKINFQLKGGMLKPGMGDVFARYSVSYLVEVAVVAALGTDPTV